MLHNTKDSNQIVQVPLKIFLGFMLIIKYLKKGKEKAQVRKVQNGKKINARMSKDENGMKCKC